MSSGVEVQVLEGTEAGKGEKADFWEPFSFLISQWFAKEILLFPFSLGHLTCSITPPSVHCKYCITSDAISSTFNRASWCKTTFPHQLELSGYLERLLYRKWRIDVRSPPPPTSCQFVEWLVLQFSPVSSSDCSLSLLLLLPRPLFLFPFLFSISLLSLLTLVPC